MKQKIAIIGVGKMGMALAKGLLHTENYQLLLFDQDFSSLQGKLTEGEFSRFTGSFIQYASITELLQEKAPTILAVKPDTIKSICHSIEDDRLLISIAAGISTLQIQEARKTRGAVIRVMPNTPFMVGEGMSVLFADQLCSETDRHLSEMIFQSGGKTLWLNEEMKMHSVTALSGSGPAFVYLFLQALEDAGVHYGLDRETARKLSLQTCKGSLIMVENEKTSAQQLIHQVTSPGGTTIAGLSALKKFHFEAAIDEAIGAAKKRSEELAK